MYVERRHEDTDLQAFFVEIFILHHGLYDYDASVSRSNDEIGVIHFEMGDFCYGYPLFDVGMVYLCCCVSEEAFIQEVFHMPKSLAIQFWECFAPVYFGTDRPLKEINEEVIPYAGLKTLIVERDTKRPMPEMRACLKGII